MKDSNQNTDTNLSNNSNQKENVDQNDNAMENITDTTDNEEYNKKDDDIADVDFEEVEDDKK